MSDDLLYDLGILERPKRTQRRTSPPPAAPQREFEDLPEGGFGSLIEDDMGMDDMSDRDDDFLLSSSLIQNFGTYTPGRSISQRSRDADRAEEAMVADAVPADDMIASLTNRDLMDLSERREFPMGLELPKEQIEDQSFFTTDPRVGGRLGIGVNFDALRPRAVSIKEQYDKIEDPLDRLIFLKQRRDQVIKDQLNEEWKQEWTPKLTNALLMVGGGGATAIGGRMALKQLVKTLGPRIQKFKALPKAQLEEFLVNTGTAVAHETIGAMTALGAVALYQYINAKTPEEQEEAAKKFEQAAMDTKAMEQQKASAPPAPAPASKMVTEEELKDTFDQGKPVTL